MLWESLVLLSIVAYLLYRWVTEFYDYFKVRGVPHDKPFPVLGSLKDLTFRKKSILEVVVDIYNKHDGPVYGIFDQRKPLYLIRDLDLVRQITIKDFEHFVNHRTFFGEEDDNLLGNSLFQMKNAKWRDMRSTLSPAFTGSKMRQMFQLMNQVAEESVKFLKQQEQAECKDENKGMGLELDLKDFCTRFTNDIIATTAFGIHVNSFENKTNEFYKMGKKMTTFTVLQGFKFLLYVHCKKIVELLKIELFDKKSIEYLRHLVLDAMKYRKEHNIHRPDMINMLMEARGIIKSDNPKSHNREWSDTEIVAQCILFFFAGFEMSALLMCFAAHEVMENPEVQQKLYEEIAAVNQELDGKQVPYEVLQNMKYLDMIITETLRKWPTAVSMDRQCTADYVFEVNGERFELKKGESVWIPVAGIHRDPKYYEQPEKFDPERFSDANKNKIVPFSYIPFGVGPRICIASRFALLEAKALLYYLVRDFRLEAAEKTTIPLQLSAKSVQLIPKNGFWLKFVTRT